MSRIWPLPAGPEALAAVTVAVVVVMLGAVGPEFHLDWTGGMPVAVLLVAGPLLVSVAVGFVAWDANEWSPAFLAAGCIAMATAPIAAGSDAFAFLGSAPSDGSTFAVAMALGAVLYTLAVVPIPPIARRRIAGPRLVVVCTGLAVVGWLVVRRFVLTDVVAPPIPHLVEGLGAGAYILSGARFEAIFRLVRLPFQALVATGCYGFAGVFALSTVVPGSVTVGLVALVFAAMPIAAILGEHRSRRGMRSVVLALFLPGALAALQRSYPGAMHTLLARIADTDPDLRGHLDRVADLSARMAWEMACTPGEVRTALMAAQLHDIGKLYLPRAVLDKEGPLDESERRTVETHARRGAELAQRLGYPEDVCVAIGQHHERWDGGGYPEGLGEHSMHSVASIVAVADTYDALISERPYKRAWTQREALNEIENQRGLAFAPDVVAALKRATGIGAEPIPIRGRVKLQRVA